MNQALEKAARIKGRKGHRPVAMVTGYDYPTARLLDEAGVDCILVGDSLGMVVLGFPDTTHVTLDHMLHHTAAVARAKTRAFIIADMPIHTYDSTDQALATARELSNAGAEAVKLEGGAAEEEKIAAIVNAGIPVVAHIGLLPQHVLEEGGYKIKGKTEDEIAKLYDDIKAVNRAGACCVVVEGVTSGLAAKLTSVSGIPTIGIGSGKNTCDGSVVVIHDLVGAFPWFVPGFIKPVANVAGEVTKAVKEWMRVIQER